MSETQQQNEEMSPTSVDQPSGSPMVHVPVSSVYVERRRDGVQALLVCSVLVVLGLLLVGVAPVMFGAGVFGGALAALNNALNPPASARTVSTQSIVNSVQPLGQLVSVSAQLAKAEIDIGIQQGGLNACGFGASHVAQGAIEAGIDLSGISDEDVMFDEANNSYTVRLPAPQLTSCRMDYIRQYNRTTTVCAVDWDEARLLAQYVALNDFRDDALEGGILERARREAQLVVSNFIHALTGSTVNITFQESANAILPASCVPEVPQGWSLDAASQTWVKNAPG